MQEPLVIDRRVGRDVEREEDHQHDGGGHEQGGLEYAKGEIRERRRILICRGEDPASALCRGGSEEVEDLRLCRGEPSLELLDGFGELGTQLLRLFHERRARPERKEREETHHAEDDPGGGDRALHRHALQDPIHGSRRRESEEDAEERRQDQEARRPEELQPDQRGDDDQRGPDEVLGAERWVGAAGAEGRRKSHS